MSDQFSGRSKNVLQLVFVFGFIAILIGIVSYLLSTKPVTGKRSVHFQVEASGGFSIITFQAGSEKISKPTTVTTPWQRSLQLPSGTQVFLTASNPTQTGALVCSISLNGQAWKKETTDAPKDGVACAGIVP
ncbi:MAG: hypothetical protein NTW32_10235 [Chloroflexi bacterium]|nr:hypothetical protein [Chloroflexota bacterium]